MVYTISDKIDKIEGALENAAMDAKFQRVKTNESEEEFDSGERWRIWKNVLVIGFAFMLHFTAFWGASNLQSSINADEALGTFTLAAIYGSLILSNIFLPTIVIKWLGCKWTIALSFIAYMPFIAAQFYPKFFTMIPAGLLVGFGGGPLWCAKCTYLTVISEAYSKIVGISSDVLVTRFFGVFFMFYQFSQVWGNLISSAVLSIGSDDSTDLLGNDTSDFNMTSILVALSTNATNSIVEDVEDIENMCGAKFCPEIIQSGANPNLKPPSSFKINLISGIYLGCMITACLTVAFFVDSLKRYNKDRVGSGSGLSALKLLIVTLKQLMNPYQLMILPITMFIGAEQAFIAADYNAAFVSCGWGISNIGFVMICFGVCNAIAAIFTGSIIKMTGRSPVIAFALALHVALLVTMLIWEPHQRTKYMFFIMAGLWGIADAVWLVQINALSGILFPGQEEASYSNFRLWESTGSVITYAYNPYLCTHVKIYLLIGLLLIGVSGYTLVEYLEFKNKDGNTETKGKFELVKEKRKSGEVAE